MTTNHVRGLTRRPESGVRRSNIWMRVCVIVAVVAGSLWAIWPPQQKIKLGLDLNGGVHLVLRVKPDSAWATSTTTRNETVEQAVRTIERRVNELGVTEPLVARYTQADQILVQLPGVADVERAKAIIRSTAQLRLTLVEQGPFADIESANAATRGRPAADLEVLPGPAGTGAAPTGTFYLVQKTPAVAGNDLRDARPSVDGYGGPAVAFTLTPEAAKRFGEFTAQHINRGLATVLDGRVTAVATIQSRIDDRGQISGLTRDEMNAQVINLRSGALPADLEYVEERTIGASLGADSIHAGVTASIGGLTLVMFFLVAYYRLAGLNALTSIVLNLLILVGLVAWIPVTVSLPGIAGLILTIGMGVDSNVLIFERIKEELLRSRTAWSAVRAGFDRVWITIVDTHITSLVAAAFLYQFGTSPIRGFATTLTIGLAANVFTSVFVSKTLFELQLRRQRSAPTTISIGRPARATPRTANFTRWGWPALALSAAVMLGGAASIVTKGLPLGIDFSGGTAIVVEFSQPGVTEARVRDAIAQLPGEEVVQRYGPASDRRMLVRVPLNEGVGPGASLEAAAAQVTHALQAAGPPEFRVVSRELVSAAIGADLRHRGLYAVAASIAAITAYIAIRFRPSFAIGAMAATFHDIGVTLACLALAGYDLTLNVTAALLTIIGYSVNDTIVIFDRVRENVRTMPDAPLTTVVNASVNQTLSRTIVTAGMTLVSVVAVYLFGGETLRGFAFTMLIGIASGTYSTVFIASAIATRLARRVHRRLPVSSATPQASRHQNEGV